ncbi:DUF2169 family type VI secretion system accessory protein [Rhizobacter sp. P5_C2]
MWQTENRTPFGVERCGVRDRDGSEVWLVALKASFDIHPDGSLGIADKQDQVALAPAFFGDPSTSSLAHEADIVWARPGTDVFVRGCAHAPAGPVQRLQVGFRVGPVQRTATVIGDRVWERGLLGTLHPGEPMAFSSMPLTWERAFGGSGPASVPTSWEPRNPVGRGLAGANGSLSGSALPNIEDPAHLIDSVRDHPAPVGFGPVARHWQPRARYAGTYDAIWQRERRPLLPDDFDLRYQRAAPVLQQVDGFLEGGEEVRLVHLHSRAAMCAFRLPVVRPTFRTLFRGRASVEHAGRITSVTLDTERARLAMVWVSELACHHDIQRLRVTQIGLSGPVRLRQHHAGEAS